MEGHGKAPEKVLGLKAVKVGEGRGLGMKTGKRIGARVLKQVRRLDPRVRRRARLLKGLGLEQEVANFIKAHSLKKGNSGDVRLLRLYLLKRFFEKGFYLMKSRSKKHPKWPYKNEADRGYSPVVEAVFEITKRTRNLDRWTVSRWSGQKIYEAMTYIFQAAGERQKAINAFGEWQDIAEKRSGGEERYPVLLNKVQIKGMLEKGEKMLEERKAGLSDYSVEAMAFIDKIVDKELGP